MWVVGLFGMCLLVTVGCGDDLGVGGPTRPPPVNHPTPDPADPASLVACHRTLEYPAKVVAQPPQEKPFDFDGDGNGDGFGASATVVTISFGGSRVTTVSTPDTYIHSVIAADVDGNGAPDLVVAVSPQIITFPPDPDTLQVWLNDGTGHFAAPLTTNAGRFGVDHLLAADVDGDGVTDLLGLITDSSGRTFVEWKGTRGAFAAASLSRSIPQDRPENPDADTTAFVLGDVTDDGVRDAVVATPGHISVLAGSANGVFANAVTVATPKFDGDVVLADMNEDGVLDLVFGDTDDTGAYVGVVLGGATFSAETRAAVAPLANPFAAPSSPVALAVGDLDGDHHLDVVATSDGSPLRTVVLAGDGRGALAMREELAILSWKPRLVDVDSDGRLDLVVARTVLHNNGTAAPFDAASIVDFAFDPGASNSSRGLRMLDLDGDGHLDVADMGARVVATRLARNGTFAGPTRLDNTAIEVGYYNPDPSSLDGVFPTALADMDNDNTQDLVLAGSGVQVFRALGGGTLSPAMQFTSGPISHYVVADFDGDGIRDVVFRYLFNQDAPTTPIVLLRGNGDGTFADPVTILEPKGRTSLAVLDIDHDGWPDLLVNDGSGVQVLANRGDGTFDPPSSLGVENVVATHDLDGDGRPDIIGRGFVALDRGPGTFERLPLDLLGVSAFGDLDGDGRVDIVSDSGTVLLNRGDGQFETLGSFDGIQGPTSLTDLDGDGILDLVSAGFPYGLVEIRYGRCR